MHSISPGLLILRRKLLAGLDPERRIRRQDTIGIHVLVLEVDRIFRDDAAGNDFAEALIAARARGVTVRVLLDSVGVGYIFPRIYYRLKAGGVGLNLTAADYVFLLDPWWNPAVEAQAIDRTHRIGQTRQVFACRLIAKDTVEEKVLELQKGKRELAEAIINGDNSVISSLGREELELLLS